MGRFVGVQQLLSFGMTAIGVHLITTPATLDSLTLLGLFSETKTDSRVPWSSRYGTAL